MKIACDTGVSGAAIEVLRQSGYEVVFWAMEEPDEWWFKEALGLGADVFVSHDWDIILMADERSKERIHLRPGVRGRDQAKQIIRGIRRIEARTGQVACTTGGNLVKGRNAC